MIRLGGNSDHRIEQVNGSLLLRRRGELLPVACLSTLLTSAEQRETAKDELQRGFVVIIRVGPLHYGLIVDAVFHSEEIVVKPLSTKLANIIYYSGNTILGALGFYALLPPCA